MAKITEGLNEGSENGHYLISFMFLKNHFNQKKANTGKAAKASGFNAHASPKRPCNRRIIALLVPQPRHFWSNKILEKHKGGPLSKKSKGKSSKPKGTATPITIFKQEIDFVFKTLFFSA